MEYLRAGGCSITSRLSVPRTCADVEPIGFESEGLFQFQLIIRVIHDEVESLEYGDDGHVNFLDRKSPSLKNLSQETGFPV